MTTSEKKMSEQLVCEDKEKCMMNSSMNEKKTWCILRHADSDLIGEIFSGKRKVYNPTEDDRHPLPPFEFFIPFGDLKQRPREAKPSDEEYQSYNAMKDEHALRTDLHHFIFICASKDKVLSILDAAWVKTLRNRLYVYRDENTHPIEISNDELERFKTILKRYDFKILNGEASGEVREGDHVSVVNGPMAGSEGLVREIHERDGQVSLTIEMVMFQDKMRIAVPGINVADVRLSTPETQQLLQDPIISNFEDKLIELLCHLHGKRGSRAINKEDMKQLEFLYQYADIVFEDNEVNRAKFAALMLICVYLMKKKEETARRLQEVESLFQRSAFNPQQSTELDCYLLTSLFIATHNPELRRQAKAWRQSHPDCSLSLRRLISISKQIRC